MGILKRLFRVYLIQMMAGVQNEVGAAPDGRLSHSANGAAAFVKKLPGLKQSSCRLE